MDILYHENREKSSSSYKQHTHKHHNQRGYTCKIIYFMTCYHSVCSVIPPIIALQSNVMTETRLESVYHTHVLRRTHRRSHYEISTFQHGLQFIMPRYTRINTLDRDETLHVFVAKRHLIPPNSFTSSTMHECDRRTDCTTVTSVAIAAMANAYGDAA